MSELPRPGWYPDPEDASSQRYWDGSRWTEERTSAPPPPDRPTDMPPPAGWYPDPEGDPGAVRYWDGTRWTDDRAPYAAVATKPRTGRSRGSDGLVVAGYIGGVLIPIVGIVIGAILIQRDNRHGPWVLGLSLLMIAIPVAVYVGSE
jgi:hypothetical protein